MECYLALKGDILLHIWKDKREVCIFSTVCNDTNGEVTSKCKENMKKPVCVIKYRFMKGADTADEYLSYCTIL
jgi:hypothetical protein